MESITEINFEQKEINYYINHLKKCLLEDQIVENLKNVKIIGKTKLTQNKTLSMA